MRLSELEKNVIRKQVRQRDPDAIVFLFGSRTQDALKGGDIDLLVESSILHFEAKLEILSGIKEEIGDQKIDLVVTRNRFTDKDPFIQIILKQVIEI